MIHIKVLFAFLILFGPLLLPAQDEAVPLIEQMQKTNGKERIDLLNEIAVFYRKTDRYKSMGYARQAYKLATANGYLPGKAVAMKNEGICWFFIGNNDSAMLCYSEALNVFANIGDEKGVSACYNNLGLISQETGKYDEALKFYQLSIDIDHKLGDEIGVATTKANLVDILIYQGNSKKALLLSNEIISLYEIKPNQEGMMIALINRAAIYDNLKQFDKAIADQKRAIAIAKALNDNYSEAMLLSNLGLVTFHKGKPDEALKLLNQVLDMSDGSDNGYDIINTLWIMSEIYASKKEYEKSNDILQKLLKRFEVIDNKREEAKVLTSLGRNLMELNEIDKAMGYLLKSLELTKEINARYELLENYRNLAHANAILHNFAAADSLQDMFAETYTSLDNRDSIVHSSERQANNDIQITASKSSVSDWMIAFILFIILSLLSVIAYRQQKTEK